MPLKSLLAKRPKMSYNGFMLRNSKEIPDDKLQVLRTAINLAYWRDTVQYPAHMQHAYTGIF